MDHLLESRLQGAESALKLQGLSPQRFGRSAYAGLSYTPSKLAGNVLYKEAASMKRVEESSSKAREWQAVGQLLRDKLRHMQEEKEGVEKALTQQITMYKRILAEAEAAHEKSLMALQAAFSEEMQRLITFKEEEAKFVQSQKELLQNRILELEDAISDLKNELNRQINNKEAIQTIVNELRKEQQVLKEEKDRLQALRKSEAETRQKQRQEQANRMHQRQLEFARREEKLATQHARNIQEANAEKQRAIDNLTATHREQLMAVEQQRINQAKIRDEELKKMKSILQSQTKKLEQALHGQRLQTQLLNESLQQEKQLSADSIRKYTSDVASLTQRNQQLQKEVQTTSRQLTQYKQQIKRTESSSTQTTVNLQATIDKLKRDIQISRREIEAHAIERDKQRLDAQEMRREIVVLRKSVERTSFLLEENSLMSREIKGLKDLLVQSSLQMERCKAQFVRLDKEKEILLVKLRELDQENETLYRVRLQMEEEARIWRETYYLNRR